MAIICSHFAKIGTMRSLNNQNNKLQLIQQTYDSPIGYIKEISKEGASLSAIIVVYDPGIRYSNWDCVYKMATITHVKICRLPSITLGY